MSFASTENHKRNVRVLAEGAQQKMTRKVDTWEYESLALVLEVIKYLPKKLQNSLQIKHIINGTKRLIGLINNTCS